MKQLQLTAGGKEGIEDICVSVYVRVCVIVVVVKQVNGNKFKKIEIVLKALMFKGILNILEITKSVENKRFN